MHVLVYHAFMENDVLLSQIHPYSIGDETKLTQLNLEITAIF